MGGFAICKVKKDSKLTSVKACHVNVWVLPAFWVNPELLYDLGVAIEVSEDATEEKIEIYLPFDCTDCKDLRPRFNDDISSLIFGEEAAKKGDLITLTDSGKRYTLLDLRSRVSKVSGITTTRNFSVWEIKLPHLEVGNLYYFRLRFESDDLGRVSQRKASGYLTNGNLFDLRFLDERDWIKAPKRPLRDFMMDMEKLQVFVITSAAFQNRATSPNLRYIRSLEGESQWYEYLGRNPSRGDRRKFLISYWKLGQWSDGDKPVSWREPARIFMDQSRDFGYLPWQNYFRVWLLSVTTLLLFPYQYTRREILNVVEHLWRHYTTGVVLTAVALPVAIIAFKKARDFITSVIKFLPTVKKTLKWLEGIYFERKKNEPS